MDDNKLRIVFEQYEIEDLLGLLTNIRTEKISKKSTKNEQ